MTDDPSDYLSPGLSKYDLIKPCIEDGVTYKKRAKETGTHRRTIKRYVDKFKNGGVDALKRKVRSDKGSPRVSDKTFKFIKGKILSTPAASLATIQRQINRLSAHSEEFKASYQQIRRVRSCLSEDLKVFARSEKEFEEKREIRIGNLTSVRQSPFAL